MRDFQMQKVYDAEGIVRGMFDYTVEFNNPTVDAHGVSITLPPEAKFGSVESVQSYVNRVVTMPSVVERFGYGGMVGVRPRKGSAKAHYEPRTRTIAVAEVGNRWALREIVVLHELAHHFADPGEHHGPGFVTTFIDLVGIVMGPEVALLVRVVYENNQVQTHQGARV